SARSTLKLRSGMESLFHLRYLRYFWRNLGCFCFQAGEELAQFVPNFSSSRETFPMQANQPYQLVTFVDREQIVLGCGIAARISQAVDQQTLDIGFHIVQNSISPHYVVPGLKRQQRLGCPSRTGIKRDHAALQTALKKESHIDRHHQRVPLGIAEMEAGKRAHAPGDTFEFHSLTAEQNSAGFASA